MTKTLGFDFNGAVAKVRRDYPEETQNITFIDSSEKNAGELLGQWLKSVSPEFQEIVFGEFSPDEMAPVIIAAAGGAASFRDPVSGKGVLFAPGDPEKNSFHEFIPSVSEAAAAAFVFHHEFAHVALKEGYVSSMTEVALCEDESRKKLLFQNFEIMADTFSVWHGLQAGYLDKQSAWQIISCRQKKDERHNTAAALQALLKIYNEKNFARLTPAALKKSAVAHARKFTNRIEP